MRAGKYFMVRHVHERHFYGVSHGKGFVKWRAEGDAEYTASVSDSQYGAYRKSPMRERLDVVCARLGSPTLDAVGCDAEEDLEQTITAEGLQIQEAIGIDQYVSGSQGHNIEAPGDIPLPAPYACTSRGEVVANSYVRILRRTDEEYIGADDQAQYNLLVAANTEAFSKWCSLRRLNNGVDQISINGEISKPWPNNRCHSTHHERFYGDVGCTGLLHHMVQCHFRRSPEHTKCPSRQQSTVGQAPTPHRTGALPRGQYWTRWGRLGTAPYITMCHKQLGHNTYGTGSLGSKGSLVSQIPWCARTVTWHFGTLGLECGSAGTGGPFLVGPYS
ncbi:unnamed protein product [Phytophthora fragariaefolia]|uniref:Unnamed protein product n=1 Tax=Phytophthora fragariaefolia TaxID=1490495 RepID=A0A9W6TYE3_9STRA|nr:unnamed protein product [Phytophthora fragariaefolia]